MKKHEIAEKPQHREINETCNLLENLFNYVVYLKYKDTYNINNKKILLYIYLGLINIT